MLDSGGGGGWEERDPAILKLFLYPPIEVSPAEGPDTGVQKQAFFSALSDVLTHRIMGYNNNKLLLKPLTFEPVFFT